MVINYEQYLKKMIRTVTCFVFLSISHGQELSSFQCFLRKYHILEQNFVIHVIIVYSTEQYKKTYQVHKMSSRKFIIRCICVDRLLSIAFYEISCMIYGSTILLKIGFPNTLIGYSRRREFTVFIIIFIQAVFLETIKNPNY